MGFSMFKVPGYSVFNYQPRYYDPEKEKREKRRNQMLLESGNETELDGKPGSSIKGSFHYVFERRKSQQRSSRIRLLIIISFLFFLAYIILAVDLSKIIAIFNR